MPKHKIDLLERKQFGQRLATLRKAAGYTLQELGNEIDMSKRMVAYYESQGGQPPLHILPKLAKALGVTVDQLVGSKPLKEFSRKPQRDRLWQRFKNVERLSPEDRKQVVQFVDTIVERERLKRQVSSQSA